MPKLAPLLLYTFALVFSATVAADGQTASQESERYGAYYGNYLVSPGHALGIDRFITDTGEPVVLISDYVSGVVRRLFPVSGTDFVMGPGFAVQSPAELHVQFVPDDKNRIVGMSVQPTVGPVSFARRVPLEEHEVTVNDGPVTLAGTLTLPATKGPHPAIVLLHGSGPLTRYSFGPYPHLFTSLGLAVLIYDKRGTGASTGTRVDASTGLLTRLPAEYYPDGLVDDALAAFRFLQRRNDIDSKQIGFWGSSEGGMLATQVAARDHQVAFAIDSSGFIGPLWETIYYQSGAYLRGQGLSSTQVKEALVFTRLWLRVARTGRDYDVFVKQREKARNEKPWILTYESSGFASLDQMRWDWAHVLSFSPVPSLAHVTCPVLGLWGELDESTNAPDAAANLRNALSKAGNRDVTVTIFPNSDHMMAEMPSRARMAPGVFDTVSAWLRTRVKIPESAPGT